jgi:hypothetical protein
MDRKKIWGIVRALLPWLISGSLLAYVMYSQNLREVADALARARLAPFFFWVVIFVVFWLFISALFFYLCLRWFVAAPSPDPDYAVPDPPAFDYRGVLRACAASYVLHMLSFFLAYGGLVVYFHRRYQVTYRRGTAVMLMSLLGSFAALGILAFTAIKLIPRELAPVHAQDQIELAGVVGLSGMGFYLLCFLTARLWNYLPESMHQDESVFTPFVRAPVYSYPLLLIILIIEMASFGLFVILTMPAFGLNPPPEAGMGLTQLVLLARGLPVSAFGIGLDQLTFPYLFQGWGDKDALVAFSIAFTFSLIAVRFVIGLPFFTHATREMFEPDEGGQEDAGAV